MEQKDVSLRPHIPIQLDIVMYKKGLYKETDKMRQGNRQDERLDLRELSDGSGDEPLRYRIGLWREEHR